MITRETLELAAKAAGYDVTLEECHGIAFAVRRQNLESSLMLINNWNPEHDDGDSARLRTDCGLSVEMSYAGAQVIDRRGSGYYARYDGHAGDKHAALRYATLMVAAEIGGRMV